MGISNGDNGFSTDGFPLPAFSEHILKIEKVGPNVSFGDFASVAFIRASHKNAGRTLYCD